MLNTPRVGEHDGRKDLVEVVLVLLGDRRDVLVKVIDGVIQASLGRIAQNVEG